VNRHSFASRFTEILLLALFSVPALSPLFTSTPTRSADGLLHLYRLVELDALWRNGIFFSRWLPDLASGYGMPLFNYYAPLVYYITTPFHSVGISFPLALNVSLATAMFVGAVGMFYFTRALVQQNFQTRFLEENGFGNFASLIAALAYLYSPYFLFNALHRGNLAEQWALAFAPFALWRFFVLTQKPNAVNWALAVFSFAAVMLSHNVTSFLFAPLLFFFALACVVSTAVRRFTETSLRSALHAPRSTLLSPFSALLLSLSLSAFFWLPALLEREFVQIARVIVTPDFDYRFNFVSPLELVAFLPRADIGRMNPAFPSTLGIVQIVLAFVGIILLITKFRVRRALPFFALAIAAFGFTVLMFSFSQPIWNNVSLLSFVQLPMRLRGLVALCLAPLIGILIFVLPTRWQSIGAAVAIVALGLSALPILYPRYARDVPLNPTRNDMFAYEQRTGALGTTSFGEYLPIWVQNPPDTSPFAEAYARGEIPDRFVIPEGVSVCGVQVYATAETLCASSQGSWRAIYRAFYFPGWRAFVNGQPVEIAPTPRTGLISFEVAEGKEVRVMFVGTESERVAEWVSVGSVILVLGIFVFGIFKNSTFHPRSWITNPATREGMPPRKDVSQSAGGDVSPRQSGDVSPKRLYTLFLLALALIAFKAFYVDRVNNPFLAHFDGERVEGISHPRDIRFGDEINLLGFDVRGTQVKRGETVRVTLYWRALPAMKNNSSTFVHLTAPDGFVLAQKDSLHPANLPTTQWELDAYVVDEHAFEIPAAVASGEYELRAGVYDPRTNTRLKTAEGADYVLLGKVRVGE